MRALLSCRIISADNSLKRTQRNDKELDEHDNLTNRVVQFRLDKNVLLALEILK